MPVKSRGNPATFTANLYYLALATDNKDIRFRAGFFWKRSKVGIN